MATILTPPSEPQPKPPAPVPIDTEKWRKIFHKLIDRVFDILKDPSFWIIA